MEKLIATIQKGKPFFDKVARNTYLKAVKDGFISAMPIVIFSSIFLLIAYVPNIWGFSWPAEVESIITKPYVYSMGVLSLVVAATTAKHFTDSLNRGMPLSNQINFLSAMVCAIVGLLILASDPIDGGFAADCLGSKGLLTAFIAAFVVGGVYKFCVSRNITIRMPEQVPPNISQTFKDIIPFSLSVVLFWLVDLVVRHFSGACAAEGIIHLFQPLFSAADGYVGIAIIYGAMSLFWFVGVHGPSIVEPAVEVALLAGMTENLAAYQAGMHADHVLSLGLQYFVVTMGGTGATLIACAMFAFLAKSKELRAVGRASMIPVSFGVNEPFLFGAPMVLNPVFLVPFVLAPVANAWLFKVFVDVLGMNGFLYTLPWTTPAPIGIVLGCGLSPLSFVFVAAAFALDFVIYFPFFKMYDLEKCEEEAQVASAELEERAAEKASRMSDAFQGRADASSVAAGSRRGPAKFARAGSRGRTKAAHSASATAGPVSYSTTRTADSAGTATAPAGAANAPAGAANAPAPAVASADALAGKKVLVLCAGGGTSGLLSNALAKVARERGIDLESAAGSYGAHLDIMADFDLVILAPQVASYYEDLKKDAQNMGVKAAACEGRQYIALTRDGEAALAFVSEQLGS